MISPPPDSRPLRRRRAVRTRDRWCRVALLLGVVAITWTVDVVGARPAAADGSGPTNFESVVDSVAPPTPGVRVRVVGGDSFLQVSADRGTEVEIPGYDGEPYLRIAADGTVERNERSAATYLNSTRDGSGVDLPKDVDSRAEPRWVQIADSGEVAWHDHRIHWMVSTAPLIDDGGVVQSWTVPLVVDGEDVTVAGRLLLHEDDLPWAAAVAVVAAVGAALLARRRGWRAPLLVVAAVVALALAVADVLVDPPGSGTTAVPIILPALALAQALGSLVAPRAVRGPALPLGAVAALAGWAVMRLGVLWMPIVPTEAPVWADRAATALVLGIAVGVAVAVLIRPDPAPDRGADGGPRSTHSSTGSSPATQSDMPPRS